VNLSRQFCREMDGCCGGGAPATAAGVVKSNEMSQNGSIVVDTLRQA
jgi:hypothetical protein